VSTVGSIYDVILYPYLVGFSSFNNISLRCLVILFVFVGNNSDQTSTAKKGVKFQGVGHAAACR